MTPTGPNPYGKEALHARIERDGSYHPANTTPELPRAFELLRITAKQYGHMIVDLCPEGRDLSVALAALLDDVLPMAIGAIARDDGQSLDLEKIREWEQVVSGLTVRMDTAQSFTDNMVGYERHPGLAHEVNKGDHA